MSHDSSTTRQTAGRTRRSSRVVVWAMAVMLPALAAVPATAQYNYRRSITVDRTKVRNPALLPIAFDKVTSAKTADGGASNLSWTHNVGSGADKLAVVSVSSKRDTSLPTYVAAGTIASGTSTITPALPSGIQTNDILLLFVETANELISISSPNGGRWTSAG